LKLSESFITNIDQRTAVYIREVERAGFAHTEFMDLWVSDREDGTNR
jgi:hypothetical protein